MTQCFNVCIMDLLIVLFSFIHAHRSHVRLNKVVLADVVIAKAPIALLIIATFQ